MFLAVSGADGILRRGINVSQGAAASWNDRWETIFDSSLFAIVNVVAAAMACLVFGFFAIELFNTLNNHGAPTLGMAAQKLMPPIIVVMLLANNGALMEAAVKSARNVINTGNRNVLEIVLTDITLEDATKALVARGVAKNEISAQISQCRDMIGERQFECLQAANEQVQATIDAYESRWLLPLPSGIDKIRSNLQSILQGEIPNPFYSERVADAVEEDEGAWYNPVGRVTALFQSLMGSVVNDFVMAVLMPIQWAYVNTLEMSLLLTALTMPIAVALTILPFPTKALFPWIIAYFGIGACQLYYNIIVGIIGIVIVNSDAVDINGYLFILALFGPALAIGMAAGGGIGIFNILASGQAALLGLSLSRLFTGSRKTA